MAAAIFDESGGDTMQHRIRAAALIVQDDRILLVKLHVNDRIFWIPPGGGLKGSESIFGCAARETWEETGLCVELDRIAYIRQLADVEQDTNHLEFFLLASSWSGSVTLNNIPDDDDPDLEAAEFFTRDEIQQITVYPEILKGEFWEDLRNGLPPTKYLGIQRT